MSESNEYLRASLLAREAVERLQQQGHSSHEAKKCVSAVINAEEFALLKGRHSFDLARFAGRLRELPN